MKCNILEGGRAPILFSLISNTVEQQANISCWSITALETHLLLVDNFPQVRNYWSKTGKALGGSAPFPSKELGLCWNWDLGLGFFPQNQEIPLNLPFQDLEPGEKGPNKAV